MFAASIQGEGVFRKKQVSKRPRYNAGLIPPQENLSVGLGPVCWTSLSTGLSEWELGPCQAEWSPTEKFKYCRLYP